MICAKSHHTGVEGMPANSKPGRELFASVSTTSKNDILYHDGQALLLMSFNTRYELKESSTLRTISTPPPPPPPQIHTGGFRKCKQGDLCHNGHEGQQKLARMDAGRKAQIRGPDTCAAGIQQQGELPALQCKLHTTPAIPAFQLPEWTALVQSILGHFGNLVQSQMLLKCVWPMPGPPPPSPFPACAPTTLCGLQETSAGRYSHLRPGGLPKVCEDEGLDKLGDEDHGGPEAAANGLQQEGVAINDLQDPVGAADEAREAQRKHIVRREFLHHLGILHHAQLGQHRHCLHIHAERPHDLRSHHMLQYRPAPTRRWCMYHADFRQQSNSMHVQATRPHEAAAGSIVVEVI